MPEIKLEKRYPNVSTEDFCEIFNEGLLTGLKAAGKNAIPVEWLRRKADEMAVKYWNGAKRLTLPMKDLPIVITRMIKEWKVENGREID